MFLFYFVFFAELGQKPVAGPSDPYPVISRAGTHTVLGFKPGSAHFLFLFFLFFSIVFEEVVTQRRGEL